MAFREKFTDQEWNTLQLAAWMAFAMVGLADGEFSDKEAAAMLGSAAAAGPDASLLDEVLASFALDRDRMSLLGGQRQAVFEQFPGEDVAVFSVMAVARDTVLEKAGGAEAGLFLGDIQFVAEKIARADKRGWFGDQVSPEETLALSAIRAALESVIK